MLGSALEQAEATPSYRLCSSVSAFWYSRQSCALVIRCPMKSYWKNSSFTRQR